MATHNAWQLYKADGGEYDHLTYRPSSSKKFVRNIQKNRKGWSPTHSEKLSRFDRVDYLVDYKENQLRCAVCKKKTNYFCKKCIVSLHPKACFSLYYTLS